MYSPKTDYFSCPSITGMSLDEQEAYLLNCGLNLNLDNYKDEQEVIKILQIKNYVKYVRKNKFESFELVRKIDQIEAQIKNWQQQKAAEIKVAVNSPLSLEEGVYAAKTVDGADILVKVLSTPVTRKWFEYLGDYLFEKTYYLTGYAGFSQIHYDNDEITQFVCKVDSFKGLDPTVYGGWKMEELMA